MLNHLDSDEIDDYPHNRGMIDNLIENTDNLINHIDIFPFHKQNGDIKSVILFLLEYNPLARDSEIGLVEPSLDLFLLNETLKIKRHIR